MQPCVRLYPDGERLIESIKTVATPALNENGLAVRGASSTEACTDEPDAPAAADGPSASQIMQSEDLLSGAIA